MANFAEEAQNRSYHRLLVAGCFQSADFKARGAGLAGSAKTSKTKARVNAEAEAIAKRDDEVGRLMQAASEEAQKELPEVRGNPNYVLASNSIAR
jgi:hypothetical protein